MVQASVHGVVRIMVGVALLATSMGATARLQAQAAAASVTLHPVAYVTLLGADGGQPVSVLSVRDQSGTQNNWNKYVEFDTSSSASPSYMGYRTYSLSTSVAPASLQSLQLQANYMGQSTTYQRWTWHIYDWTTGTWVAIGDNTAANEWRWTLLTFNIGGTLAHYVNPQGQARIDVEANNAYDNADLDYEALVVTYAGGAPTGTATPTGTAIAPTATATVVPPTSTSSPIPATPSMTAIPPTSTRTPVPPTATSTPTRPAATSTTVPPTATRTPAPPTATNTADPPSATATSVPASGMWQPTPGTTWKLEIGATPNLSTLAAVQAYDIDGFDNPASTVATLHARGIKVLCYIDAGTYENWRPDAGSFPSALLGNSDGWPGENWLDIRSSGPNYGTLQAIMRTRAQMCKNSGFDAIDWDNVDEYENSSGFPVTAADQITYNTFLANTAHALGLAVGLKNDVDQVATLQPSFDFAINEECFKYSECSTEAPFINANKAVFEVEYSDDGMTTSMFCPQANAMRFSSALATLSLDGTWTPCW